MLYGLECYYYVIWATVLESPRLFHPHLRKRIRSVAGNWLFHGRRWRNPENRKDRDALNAGYDALVAAFPVFSRCSRDRFLKTISGFCASWSCSSQRGRDVPFPPGPSPTPSDDERPPPPRDGSSCPGLESGAADLQAQEQRRAVEHDEGMDSSLRLQGSSGAELSRSSGSEVTRARLDLSPCPRFHFFLVPCRTFFTTPAPPSHPVIEPGL
jgi:hypothetical protein